MTSHGGDGERTGVVVVENGEYPRGKDENEGTVFDSYTGGLTRNYVSPVKYEPDVYKTTKGWGPILGFKNGMFASI